MTIISEHTSTADGVTAIISVLPSGRFMVALRDDDSGNIVDFKKIYQTLDEASEYAYSLVQQKAI
jgi:hypothetical protein